HTRLQGDWSSDVCSSDLSGVIVMGDADMKCFAGHEGVGFAPRHESVDVPELVLDPALLKLRSPRNIDYHFAGTFSGLGSGSVVFVGIFFGTGTVSGSATPVFFVSPIFIYVSSDGKAVFF